MDIEDDIKMTHLLKEVALLLGTACVTRLKASGVQENITQWLLTGTEIPHLAVSESLRIFKVPVLFQLAGLMLTIKLKM